MSVIRAGRTRQIVKDDGLHRTSVRVRIGGDVRTLYFDTDPEIPFVDHNLGDIWVPALMMLAMRRGERLRLNDPISPGRRAQLRKIQDIFSAWYPTRMSRVRIVTPPTDESPSPARPRLRGRRPVPDDRIAATCFTGGVDSFNSLIKHKRRIRGLVYGFGIDVPRHEVDAAKRVGELLADVAESSGTRLLTADTNVRSFLGKEISWGFEGHGAAIASLGAVFSPLVKTLYVPSTHSYAVPFPWGSHPLVDDLWSTERLAVVHDGAESGRVGKLARLADDELAHRHLRVCYKGFADSNCGRCLKCMRTMAGLALLGRLDRFETFAEPLDVGRLRKHKLRTDNDLFQTQDVYELALRTEGHDELRDALGELLVDYRRRAIGAGSGWTPGDPVEDNWDGRLRPR